MKVILFSFVCTIDFYYFLGGKLFFWQSASTLYQICWVLLLRKCRTCWHSTYYVLSRNRWLSCNGKKYYRTIGQAKSNSVLYCTYLERQMHFFVGGEGVKFTVFIWPGFSCHLDLCWAEIVLCSTGTPTLVNVKTSVWC